MSHFAKVNSDGIVENVIVAEQDFIDSLPAEDGVSWVQTSYNTYGGKHYDPETGLEDDKPQLRMNYAGVGMKYDADRDAFIPIQPFESWTLDDDTCLWVAPVAYPDDGGYYTWNEETSSWDELEG